MTSSLRHNDVITAEVLDFYEILAISSLFSVSVQFQFIVLPVFDL